eukprot:4988956-Amphidinium_carterae.1
MPTDVSAGSFVSAGSLTSYLSMCFSIHEVAVLSREVPRNSERFSKCYMLGWHSTKLIKETACAILLLGGAPVSYTHLRAHETEADL